MTLALALWIAGTALADESACAEGTYRSGDECVETCPEGTAPAEGKCVEVVDVSASQLEDTEAAFRHPGGRTVITEEELIEGGATGIGEALRKVPGVKVVEASGTGNTDTKLNIGVRGLNPRLSARSTVLLDEVPLAVAPYGQPQMSLFPVSLFNIQSIDVVRGGSSIRFGPQNVGGVINLRTHDIPETLTAAGLVQTNRWGDTLVDVQLGGSTGDFGVLAEYTPRMGSGYRDESRKEIHGGLLKLWARPVRALEIESNTHGYYEESELPGGLYPEDYTEDPQASMRPLDGFSGRRVGSSLDVTLQASTNLQLQVLAFGNLSRRGFRLADRPEPESSQVFTMPRSYRTVGTEPRIAWRFQTGEGITHELNAGYRRVFEDAHYEMRTLDRYTGEETLDLDDDAQVAADALYIEDELLLFDDHVRVAGGVRYEDVRIARRNNLRQELLGADYSEWLPAASFTWTPSPTVSTFASYARSFGSPQFMQITLAGAESALDAEVADTYEAGFRLLEAGGFDAEFTGFHMAFQDQIEFDETTFENIGKTWHTGLEYSVYFWPGWYAPALEGLELEAGDTWLYTGVVSGLYEGLELPYAPRHSVWWDVWFTFGDELEVGIDGWWEPEQFSDSLNSTEASPTGSYGPIPSFTVWNVRARYTRDLAEDLGLDLRAGIKNVFGEEYWYRSEDINEGILPSPPMTPYGSVALRWSR